MPSISLTDPTAHTNADAGLIATNNGNLRTLLNGGIDAANLLGAPSLVSGEVPVWNGTQFVRSTVTRIGISSIASGTPDGTKYIRDDGTLQSFPAAPTFLGVQKDYAEVTSNQTSTATTAAGATAIITGNSVAYNGTDVVMIEFEAVSATHSVANAIMKWNLYDGSTDLGVMCQSWETTTGTGNMHVRGSRRLTPSNASHTYSIRAWSNTAGTVTTEAGAGGAGVLLPMFIRIWRIA